MNLHPHLTRTEYRALRHAYRHARREDELAAGRMPRLSSEWRRRPLSPERGRADAIAAQLDPWLVATFSRTPPLPMGSWTTRARLNLRACERSRKATMAKALATIAAYEASRAAA